MPADYKRRGDGRGKKPLPGFIWLITGLGIGLFVALLVYLDGQPDTGSNFGTAVQKELNKIKQKPVEKKGKTSSKQEPKFNFYTILPELEVLIPDSETQPPKSSTTPTGNNLNPDKQYILQAGSFQNLLTQKSRRPLSPCLAMKPASSMSPSTVMPGTGFDWARTQTPGSFTRPSPCYIRMISAQWRWRSNKIEHTLAYFKPLRMCGNIAALTGGSIVFYIKTTIYAYFFMPCTIGLSELRAVKPAKLGEHYGFI